MYTVQVHPNIYRITTPYEGGGVVYLYLIKGDQVALVDSGTASSPSRVITPALEEIGMSFSDVDMILCTHGHLDHAGGNVAAKRASGAKIYMHRDDLFLAENLEAEIEFHTAPLRGLDFPQRFLDGRREFITAAAGAEKVPVNATMSNGDVLDLGKEIKLTVVHTPGHTPGHVVLFWESEGVLFTADSVQAQAIRPGGYPYYFDAGGYRRSLALMARLDYRMLCLGHAFVGGSPISDPTRTDEDAKSFMQESIRVADAINRAVSVAIKQMLGATKREIAMAALSELGYELPQQRLRDTQMPASAGPTMFAHIEAALNGSYPA